MSFVERSLHKYFVCQISAKYFLDFNDLWARGMKNSDSGVDEAFEAADFGDRLWLFFRKNSRFLSLSALGVVVCLLGFGTWRLCVNHEISKMRASYSKLRTLEDKIGFVNTYGKHKLAGVVSLAIADNYLSTGDYAAALSFYEAGEKILKSTLLLPRARIGMAEAMYKMDRFADAEKILNSIVYDRNFDRALRGNAAFVLAAMLDDINNSEKLSTLVKDLGNLELTTAAVNAIHEISAEN